MLKGAELDTAEYRVHRHRMRQWHWIGLQFPAIEDDMTGNHPHIFTSKILYQPEILALNLRRRQPAI